MAALTSLKTVKEGENVPLHTGLTQIQSTDTIEWRYAADDKLIAEINGGNRRTLPGADGRFLSKLSLDEITGNLTINNIRTIHTGLYKLKISGRKTKNKRFIVTVSGKYINSSVVIMIVQQLFRLLFSVD